MAANNNTQLNSTITRALAARALTFLALSWAVFLGVDLAIAAARTPASAFAHAIALVSRSTITASVSWAWIVVPVAVARPAFEYRRTQRPPPRVSWQVLELASPPVLIPALAHAFSAVGTYFVLARPLLVLVGLDGSRHDYTFFHLIRDCIYSLNNNKTDWTSWPYPTLPWTLRSDPFRARRTWRRRTRCSLWPGNGLVPPSSQRLPVTCGDCGPWNSRSQSPRLLCSSWPLPGRVATGHFCHFRSCRWSCTRAPMPRLSARGIML
ncbi:hypothetical protein BC828DRAFT_386124 [Blastocladiella britannica]|nr:hypothetical protein BC828DRAFT_386124 [Blastocladiella britannica]